MTDGTASSADARLACLLKKERKVLLEERRGKMMDKSAAAARHMNEKYTVKEVYLFGSLARGRVHDRSDIDMLVIGAPPDPERMTLAADVDRIISPFEGHVLFADEVSEGFRRSAIARGVRLI